MAGGGRGHEHLRPWGRKASRPRHNTSLPTRTLRPCSSDLSHPAMKRAASSCHRTRAPPHGQRFLGEAVAVEAMVDRHIHIITFKRDRYRLEASTTNWPPPMQRREPRRIQPSLAISRLAFRDDDRGPRGVRVAVVGRTERPFGCCLVALSVRVSAGCYRARPRLSSTEAKASTPSAVGGARQSWT